MWRRHWADGLWFLAWTVGSSLWCLTAAAQLGPTFDEPLYLERGLDGWRHFSHWGLLQLGTMPLPIDVQTLPLYLWEVGHGAAIDPRADLGDVLFWMRAGNLPFWWLFLGYGWLTGRLMAGPWGSRLAVVLLACEPNLLAHAALATTDLAVTACLLALVYHFRAGREGNRFRRLVLPALWFGLAVAAKASAMIYGPLCLIAIELHRWWTSNGGLWTVKQGLAPSGHLRSTVRDFLWIGAGGMTVATIYCGSDFRPHPSFIEWAGSLPDNAFGSCMVWLADHLCIFSNAIEGIVRQVKHNVRGHGTYLLGEAQPRSLWYYFPVLLTIKLTIPILAAPLVVAITCARALANWACWTALVLLFFSLTFRVQIGIRLVLPLVSLAVIGLAAALVEAQRSARWPWTRAALGGTVACGALWMAIAAAAVWPHGLCYVNELWGGTARGYELVSDSNYDWGQGLPELLAWQQKNGGDIDVWYFGYGQTEVNPRLREVQMHNLKVDGPEQMLSYLRGRYFAVGTTMLYGNATTLASHRNAAEFLRSCQPAARTMTFLIYERQALIEACQRLARLTPRPEHTER